MAGGSFSRRVRFYCINPRDCFYTVTGSCFQAISLDPSPFERVTWWVKSAIWVAAHRSILSAWQSNQQFRIEKDTFGELQVRSDRYWGAQTQRYDLSLVDVMLSLRPCF